MHVLITGGAGFLGSHTADKLLAEGCKVRILDNLTEQVHGNISYPPYLSRNVELVTGNILDPATVDRCLEGVDAVLHLASCVGVGQSMYEIAHYTETNDLGTAVLLQAMKNRKIRRLVVASSMSIYGEGLYETAEGEPVEVEERSASRLRAHRWDLEAGGAPLTPVATPETKRPSLSSVYALNKYVQERMSLLIGQAYGIPTIALRFFNIYGPRQALSNPYTGVLAIFAARLLNDKAPMIFEDGEQRRDFVHVSDAANACFRALVAAPEIGGAYNIGSGVSRSIVSVAEDLIRATGKTDIRPVVTGEGRTGDIRHCFADIGKACAELGYEPATSFRDGIAELSDWLAGQQAVDHVDRATAELKKRGLVA